MESEVQNYYIIDNKINKVLDNYLPQMRKQLKVD